MEQVFDGLSDGILIIRADRSIAYANPAFARLWRVPGELMDFRNDFALVNHVLSQLAEPTRFIHEVERLYLSQAPSLDELAFKDGRLFRRRSVAVESPGAQPARVWIFTDISDTQPSRLNSLPAKRPGLFSGLFKG
jgi:PAS domain-containing protein